MDSNEDEGVCYAQPVTFDDRVRIVRDFVERCEYEIPIAIDLVHNPANEVYAGWPERFYIVDDNGTIAYKGETGPFGYHPEEVAAWLMKRFPPQVLPPSDVSAERILREPMTVRALESSESRETWRVAIDRSNLATIGRGPKTKSVPLGPDRALALRRAIADEGFFAWTEASGEPLVEGSTRSLTIQLGDTSKVVHRYLPPGNDDAGDDEAAPSIDGFEKIWNQLRSLDT